MTTKDFLNVRAHSHLDHPHRGISRQPANHNVAITLLGCVAAATVLVILWGLYAYG